MINIKRAWIIPAVICLLLLVAWPFRWEKGPVQSDSKAKIVHMRDRWTGQAWVALYGVVDGQLLSGEMRPVPSNADVEKRKKQILARSEEVQKRKELENRLAKYEEIKKLNSAANAKYKELIEKNYQKKREEEECNSDLYFQLPLLPMPSDVLELEERHKLCENGIPQSIINGRVAYFNADREEKKTREEIAKQSEQAETTARSELVRLAWRKRNIVTGVWAGLVVLSAIMIGVLFIRDSRSRHG